MCYRTLHTCALSLKVYSFSLSSVELYWRDTLKLANSAWILQQCSGLCVVWNHFQSFFDHNLYKVCFLLFSPSFFFKSTFLGKQTSIFIFTASDITNNQHAVAIVWKIPCSKKQDVLNPVTNRLCLALPWNYSTYRTKEMIGTLHTFEISCYEW